MTTYHSDWIDKSYRYEKVSETEMLNGAKVPTYAPVARPVIVCLCGSTRFKEAFEKAARDETLAGRVVLSVGMFGHVEELDMAGSVKRQLDKLHLFKVELADEVLILNVGSYIGESTRNELEYAKGLGKTIRYLEPVEGRCDVVHP